ncbi:MAG: hypothetical protein J5747_05500 [Spirochaetaceae bacterium]|nr:hypothetical protein [Spirochaetaceae bacterium]MBO4705235.1 hypothetical protein [Spirochaetaceae bacterium]
MKIEINGQPLAFTLENEKTTGDILNALEEQFEKNDSTIIEIELNGKKITAEEIESLSSRAIDDNDSISVKSVCADGIIMSLKELANDFEPLCTELEELPVLMQQNDDKKSYDIINRFAESFDILCHLATLSSLFPAKFEGKKIAEKSLADFLKDFSPILTDFEDSLKNKDTVLTGDLAEYELKPRLEAYISDIAGF